MKASDLTDPPVPDECRDWLDDTLRELDEKVTNQATSLWRNVAPRGGKAVIEWTAADLVADLLDAVLTGNYARALAICYRALARPDIGTRRIYILLMLPVIRKVGQAWADDTASFEQTSLAFSLLHRLLDRLVQATAQASGEAGTRIDLSLIAAEQPIMVAVAPGDSHSFGAMILTQELRLRGWAVTFFDHRQTDAAIATLSQQAFDTLAISVSCDESLAGLADFVTTCRMANRAPKLEILIGGAAIQAPFDQYGFLQADKVGLGIEDVATYLSHRNGEGHPNKWN